MSRIFLSHSSSNNAEAIALNNWLKAEGFDDIFLDLDPQRGIVAGERWERKLNEAASRCEAVVFLISRDWIASGWCRKEMSLAHRLNKRMFGVLIEDIPPAEVPKDISGEWQLVNLASGRDGIQLRAVLPITHIEETVTFSAEGLLRLRRGLMEAGLDPKYFEWDINRPPYPGLRALQFEDAGIFFGRDASIVTALDALRGLREATPPRMLVILGASGAGKSSFLRAGLLPRLARDDRHFLTLPAIRPERAALTGEEGLIASLEGACCKYGLAQTRGNLKTVLAEGPAALQGLLAALLTKASPPSLDEAVPPRPPTVVIAVDQGEELFLPDGAEEATRLLALLAPLTTLPPPAPQIALVVTIRTDAYEPLQSARGPAAFLADTKQQTFSLPPMLKANYRDVIEAPPARLASTARKLTIESALTEALLADIEAGGGKDALPLLAFTLQRLHDEYGGDGDLKLDEYRRLGGIAGSIDAAVEHALKAADLDPAIPKDRTARLNLLRRGLIPWLAGIDPDTGAPRRRVARQSDIPAESRALIDRLVEARLLSTDRDPETGKPTIEPAHESLLRQWGQLEGWLKDDSGALAVLEGVRRAAAEWRANAEQPAWLAHTGSRLAEAEKVGAREAFAGFLIESDTRYLAAARAAETARVKRERWLNRATRVAAIIALLAAGIAGWQNALITEQARQTAQQASVITKQSTEIKQTLDVSLRTESLFRAQQAQDAIRRGDAAEVILLALLGLPDDSAADKARRDRPYVPEAEIALRNALEEQREQHVLSGHNQEVTSLAVLSDARIVTGSKDTTARIWEPETGRELQKLQGHESRITSLGVLPNGRIVTGSDDTTARVWDPGTGRELQKLQGHEGAITSLAVLPDGAVVTGSTDHTARVWDADTGKELQKLQGHTDLITSLVVLSDARIVTGSTDDTARIWNPKVGKALLKLEGHEDLVSSLAVLPDGRIVTGSKDTTARVWDPETGKELQELQGHEAEISSIAVLPDGRIVTGSEDNTARVWDPATGKELLRLEGHDDSISSLAVLPDGRIVTGSNDATARVWDPTTGKVLQRLVVHDGGIWNLALFPDGRIVTGSNDTTARISDAKVGHQLQTLEGHQDGIWSLAVLPDGSVVTGSSDHTARIWDPMIGRELQELKGHKNFISTLAVLPNGRIVTGSKDTTAKVWNPKTGEELQKLEGHTDLITSLAVLSDARIVTGSNDTTARIWEPETGRELLKLKGHVGSILSLAVLPDGRIVTGSEDKTARVWDPATGKGLLTLEGHEKGLLSLAVLPDGRIVTASADKTARVWDPVTGKELQKLGHKSAIEHLAVLPDGRIVTGSWDGTARVWDPATGKALLTLEGHETAITALTILPNSTIVTGSRDKTVRVWDSRTGGQLQMFAGHSDLITSLAVLTNGAIVSGSRDKTARMWEALPTMPDLVEYARARAPRCMTPARRRASFAPEVIEPWCARLEKWPFDAAGALVVSSDLLRQGETQDAETIRAARLVHDPASIAGFDESWSVAHFDRGWSILSLSSGSDMAAEAEFAAALARSPKIQAKIDAAWTGIYVARVKSLFKSGKSEEARNVIAEAVARQKLIAVNLARLSQRGSPAGSA